MADGVAYEIVHAVPGRLRVRIAELRTVPGFADGFIASFMAHAGILGVRVNAWCASAVISYDPTMLTLQDARRALDKTPRLPAPAAVVTSRAQPPQAPTGAYGSLVAAGGRVAPPWAQLALGGAAFAASLVGVPPVVTSTLLAAAVAPIAGRALRNLIEERKPGVDALDATAAVMMIMRGNVLAAGFMTALIGLGEFIRDRTARRSQALIADLLGLAGRSAWVVHGSRRVRVPAEQVRAGETVVVYPGDMVPVDGIVTRGHAFVDQRTLTGESMPVEISAGSHAYAATVVVEGKVYMRCEAAGHDTRAGMVVDLVRTAPLHETRTQNYAAMIADRMVIPIFLTAGATFALTRDVTRAMTVLIIDFATGIRIAAPTAILASMQRAARRGILIKGGGALERLASVDAVMFDKTGTLTRGEPEVTDVISVNGVAPRDVLLFAAAAEQRLRHPAARAIVRHARKEGLVIPDRGESHYTLGMGVRADVDGVAVLVGSRRLMESQGIAMGPVEEAQADVRARGESLGYVAVNGELAGLVAYNDPLRPEAREVIAGLRRRGVIDIVMVTGDNPAPARAAAEDAGITEVVAGAFPEQKAEIVRALKEKGRCVAVVGDGINDSPALAHADVAVSLHGAADVARERADVVLTDDDLRRLPEAIDIARDAMRLVRQNLGIVAVPNGAGLLLGATGLIGPGMATLANNGSAIAAALNSLRPLLAGSEVPLEQINGEA
jgi:P-type Cu2+ transporter